MESRGGVLVIRLSGAEGVTRLLEKTLPRALAPAPSQNASPSLS